MSSPSALDGIRVIDFGQYIAGPMAAMMLGDYGADVIRVDPPGGPRFATAANATWNRNKRSIVLDLKAPADLDIARKLVTTADVVTENFRPGVMDRLGLGPKAMGALNPRLVYCSLPGFLPEDPRAGMRAWEGVLGAATACYSTKPILKIEHPVYNCLPFSSIYGANWGALAIVIALNERERSGRGQAIEVPLFGATFTAFSGLALKVHGKPTMPALTTWRYARCRDGRWFLYVPRGSHANLLKDYGEAAQISDKSTPEAVLNFIDELFLTRTTKEWEPYFASIGAEGTTCYTSLEWNEHQLARLSGCIGEFEDPELGRFSGPGLGVRLSATPGAVRRPRPKLDANRTEILGELGDRGMQSGSGGALLRSALEGVKVLDLGIILAIPSCGRTLAEFGADVIKIDSPHRNPVSWHNDINRAKRSILLDLKSPEGLDIFWRLVETADVVIENFRTGVADKLGIGYEAVHARRPDIVYCSVNAFGLTEGYYRRPGREVLVQALAGMQVRYGGGKPAENPFIANDYATGLGACYGVALALLHRQRTGRGQYVNNALIFSATLLQSGLLQNYPGKSWDEPGGLDATGRGALYRFYRARDGWVFLAARRNELAKCPVFADLAGNADADLSATLEQRFQERSADEWVKLLTEAGIAAHRVIQQFNELMEDPVVIGQGLSVTREHAGQGMITTTGPTVRLSRTPVSVCRPAVMPGADAQSILAEVGMADQLQGLIGKGVIRVEGVVPGGAS